MSGTLATELRLLEAGDTATVQEIFDGLGPRSRELRFLAPKPRLTAADLRLLSEVDHEDHVAILAFSEGRPVGVARFVRDPGVPSSADIAVAVVDRSQNRGVATMLTSELVQRARAVGVRRFTLSMARDNEAARRLLDRAPGRVELVASDRETEEFAVTLHDTRRPPGRAARPT
jgi:RimJ/RimL family protein N-acetyltransferase